MRKVLLFILFLTVVQHCRAQDGTLDSSFGSAGKFISNFVGQTSLPKAIVQQDGKILQLSSAHINGFNQGVILRYHVNGGIDSSFGNNGKFIGNLSLKHSFDDLVMQPDGKIIAVGVAGDTAKILLVRLNSNGTPDANFGNNGYSIVQFETNPTRVYAVALQTDGKIVCAGSVGLATGSRTAICRLTTSGVIDPSFDNDGFVISEFGTINEYFTDAVIMPDNRIVAGGQIVAGLVVARFTASGQPDNSFNNSGSFISGFGFNEVYCRSVTLQTDGKIIAGGTAVDGNGNDYLCFRLGTNGSLDNSFGNGGIAKINVASATENGRAVVVQSDGKILMTGETMPVPVDYNIAVIRLNSSGSLDFSFGVNGRSFIDINSGSRDNSGAIISQGSKIIISATMHIGTIPIPTVLRLKNSSTLLLPGECNLIPPIISASGPTNFCQGSTLNMTVNPGTGVQWNLNGLAIAGATNSSYNASQAGNYTAIAASGVCSSSPSNSISVTVKPTPPVPTVTLVGNVLSSSAASGNQWYLNGVLIPGATSQSYTAIQNGFYTVRVTINGCTSTSSLPVIYIATSTTLVPGAILQIGPNPVKDKLLVSYSGNEKLILEVLDYSGKIIITRAGFQHSNEIDLAGFPAGVYLVRVTSIKTRTEVKKLILKL